MKELNKEELEDLMLLADALEKIICERKSAKSYTCDSLFVKV